MYILCGPSYCDEMSCQVSISNINSSSSRLCGLVNTVFLIIYLIDDKGKGIITKIVYSVLVKPA